MGPWFGVMFIANILNTLLLYLVGRFTIGSEIFSIRSSGSTTATNRPLVGPCLSPAQQAHSRATVYRGAMISP